MPLGVAEAQTVVVGGKVYIGGGVVEGGNFKVLEYTIETGLWREIKTPVEFFCMAAINGQLVIIGGSMKDKPCNKIWVLERTWKSRFPELRTATDASSAVGYKKWVIVAGKNCVEVFDSRRNMWFTATPFHVNRVSRPILTMIQEMLYVVIGKQAFCVSIEELISDAMSERQKPTAWEELRETHVYEPVLTSVNGNLLALGAWDVPSSTIAMYLQQTRQWLEVEELKTPRMLCTCVTLPNTVELMVIGGKNAADEYIRTIDVYEL